MPHAFGHCAHGGHALIRKGIHRRIRMSPGQPRQTRIPKTLTDLPAFTPVILFPLRRIFIEPAGARLK